MIKIEEVTSEKLKITFPFDMNIINKVKEIPNRKFDPEEKCWFVPSIFILDLIDKLKDYTIEIDAEMKSEIFDITKYQLKTKPFEHQIDGIKFGLENNSWLLGDEMGLGKTKQAIDIAVIKKQEENYKHCLIICGVNGLKWNWLEEINIHSDESAYILGQYINSKGKMRIGTNEDKLNDLDNLPDDYFLITNMETLRIKEDTGRMYGKYKIYRYPFAEKINELCKQGKINMMVFDEMHKCKNVSSHQGKGLLKMSDCKNKIAMTGTPIMNKPLDLYIALKWLGHEQYNYNQFLSYYTIKGGYGGKEVVGYKNLSQLNAMLKKMMLRRKKQDVLDLPEKTNVIDYVEMTDNQEIIYAEVLENILEEIDKIKLLNNPLTELIRLRQATGYTGILSSNIKESAKLDRLEEILEELTANNKKAIIFSNWTSITDEVVKRFKKYNPAIITGNTKDTERKLEENKFKNDASCKIIVGTIGAMGTGLTLTSASDVIFLDSPWNRALKEQAEDRAHRIGQKNNVTITTIVCKDTIDERIENIIHRKGVLADEVVDNIKADKNKMLNYLLS